MTVKFEILDDDKDKFDSRGILKDGATLTTKMFAKDGRPNPDLTPVQLAIASTRAAMQSFDSSLHRPGYRYGPATGTADTAAARQSTRFGVHDSATEDAYAAHDREMADAWKTKTTDKASPAGAYPASDADEGDACTIDGRPGTLCTIDGHEGYLECIANDDSDGDDNVNPYDSRTGKFDSVKAQQIKDAAYAAYDAEAREAYKRKG